jgi:hypothetical protein
MDMTGRSKPAGSLGMQPVRDLGILEQAPPTTWRLRNFLERRRGLPALAGARMLGTVLGVTTLRSKLFGAVYRPDFESLDPETRLKLKIVLGARIDEASGYLNKLREDVADWPRDVRELARHFGGVPVLNYGLLSNRVVTTVGVGYIVDAFQNLVEPENMKFHGFGTGTTAEAVGDTTLVTELTTQYATDNTRPTGSLAEGASGNIFRTVGTLSPDTGGTIAITEHGIFSAASGGVLLDRSVFSAVNLVAGSDSLQVTYEITFSAGG